MASADRTYTLAGVARMLGVPQHRLIHLCEKQVVAPDVKDAGGRGSSRVFSARNVLELAVALRLRDMMLPVAAAGAIVHVLRALEDQLAQELPNFSLAESLTSAAAPDLRVIISDGSRIFFTLGRGKKPPRLFGGISIEDVAGNAPVPSGGLTAIEGQRTKRGFGGLEQSSFGRFEISVTAIAQSIPAFPEV
jgi:DNA-binding transcriptional MerR regulator